MTTAIIQSWSCGPSLPPVSCARRKRALTNRPSLGLSPVSRLFSPLSPDLFPPYDDYDDPTNHADPLVRSHGRQWSIPVAASGQFLMSLDTSATLRRHLPNFHVFHPSSPDPSSHSYYDELSTARHDLVGRQRPVLVAATVQFSMSLDTRASGCVDVLPTTEVRHRRGVRGEVGPGRVSVGAVPPDPVVDHRQLAGERGQLLPAPAQPQVNRPGPTGSPGETRAPHLEEDAASHSHHQAEISSGQTAPAPQSPLPHPIPIHI